MSFFSEKFKLIKKKNQTHTKAMDQAIAQHADIYKVVCVPVHLKATKKPGGSLFWNCRESETYLSSIRTDIHPGHITIGFVLKVKKSSTDKDHYL